MIVQANTHLGFNCKDLEKTKKFYTEILGCTEKFVLNYGDLIPDTPERLAKMDPQLLAKLEKVKDVPWLVYLEWIEGYFIELFNELDAHLDNPYNPENYGYTHFAYVVDDIHAYYQELLDKGAGEYIDIVPGPSIDRNFCMWLHDPEGNRIEVQQYGKFAMQKIGKSLGDQAGIDWVAQWK